MTLEVKRQGVLTKAEKALILLHGRGGTPSSILPIAKRICDEKFYIVAPQAPDNRWYPFSFMFDEKQNEPWLSNSIAYVKTLVEEIEKHIPKSNIFIGGFSQGACMALEFSARYADKYGGIIAFSGGLIGHEINLGKYHGDYKKTKVFIGNSDDDPFIPLTRSQESKEVLAKLGADVTFKVYPGMAHIICDDELNWVKHNMTQSG